MTGQIKHVPKSWTIVKVSEVTDYVQRGRGYTYVQGGDLPIVNQRCIRSDSIDFTHLKFTNSDMIKLAARRGLVPGDVLWNSTGTGTLGRAAIFRGNPGFSLTVVDSHVTIIRPSSAITSSFLFHYISSSLVQDRLSELQTGSTGQVELNLTTILALDVPLPPLGEQRRITDALTTIRSRIHQVIRDVETSRELLERYFASLLSAAMSGRLTAGSAEQRDPNELEGLLQHLDAQRKTLDMNVRAKPGMAPLGRASVGLPSGWTNTRLEVLTEPGRPIRYGILQPGPDTPSGVPYVRVVDIKQSTIDLESVRRTSSTIAEKYRRAQLRTGDILLSIRGTVGKVAQVPSPLDGANITQDSVRISLAVPIASRYVFWYLHSDAARSYMKENQKGIAVRGINVSDVRVMPIPLPPVGEQHEIARQLDYASDWIARVASEQALTSAVAKRLLSATGARAMQGGLVAQDPAEGNAAEELAKIKVQSVQEASDVRLAAVPRAEEPRNQSALGDSPVVPLNLVEALRASPDGLSPYDLMIAAGFDLEQVSEFYATLANAVENEAVVETRPTPSSVLLRAA